MAAHIVPLGLALGVFAIGVLVYLLDRPAGSAIGLPQAWQAGAHAPLRAGAQLFGAMGGNLPSFAHAFAFALLSCLLLPPPLRRPLAPALACAFWAALDAAFEILQIPALARPVAAALLSGDAPSAWLGACAAYLLHGRFDPLDLLASNLGAAAAFACAVACARAGTRSPEPRLDAKEVPT